MESEKDYWRHWKSFFSDVRQRMKQPLAHPPFVLYFLVITLGVGGIGVWLEAYKAFSTPTFEAKLLVPRSLSTYLLAVLATAAADLVLSIEQTQTKRSMQMFALSALLGGTALALVGLNITLLRWAYGCAILGTIMALLLWLVANSDNSKLFEPTPPVDAATGGDPENIKGDLNGIIAE